MAGDSSIAEAPSSTHATSKTRTGGPSFLLASGASVVALGTILLLGLWRELDRFLPYLLLVVGAGILFTSVDLLVAPGESPRPKRDRTPAPPPATAEPSSPLARPKVVQPRPRLREHHPHSGLGRAAVSAATKPGDEIWRRWAIPRPRPLGAELVGPVPETAYCPPKLGAFVAFPARDQDLQFPALERPPVGKASGSSTPSSSAPLLDLRRGESFWSSDPPVPSKKFGRSGPFSDSELDTLFPRVADSTSLGGAPLAPIPSDRSCGPGSLLPSPELSPSRSLEGGPGPSKVPDAQTPPLPDSQPNAEAASAPCPIPTGAAVGPLLAGPVALLPTLDALDHMVALEALNPTPPHLRSSLPPKPSGSSSGRVGPVARQTARWHCADCSQALSDFRAWVECPRCSQPICRRCLSAAFLTGEEGHCAECRNS